MPIELVPAGTRIDFIGKRRLCAYLSLGVLLASLLAIPLRGIRLGIDFAGGTEFQVRFAAGTAVGEGAIRSVVTRCGVHDPSVVRYGETQELEFLIRFLVVEARSGGEDAAADAACPLTDEQREQLAATAAAVGGEADPSGEIIDRLIRAMGNEIGELEVQRVEFVGPRVGGELRRDGITALAIACVFILIYIAIRFSLRFAPGAVLALVHDVGITAGIFVIFGLEFDLRVLAALLAILGYSLNDTIIIYDRIRENMELRTKHDLVDVLNRSVNQTLARTVLTSGTTFAAVMALLFLGGEVIRPFAIAMSIGIVVGTYSSVFIAAPTLLFLETRFGGAGPGVDASRGSEKPASTHPAAKPSGRRKRGKRTKAGAAR
ncbi:MAG: protein translocase subunit SecF [Myxococcota bacterium]